MSNEDSGSKGPGNGLGALPEAFRVVLEATAKMEKLWQEKVPEIVSTAAAIEKHLQRAYSEVDFERLAEAAAAIPKRHRRIQPYLTERSWCLPSCVDIASVRYIEGLKKVDKHQAVEEYLVKCMKRDLDYMKGFILDQNPERKEILAQAFEAHETGLYAASIPLMLIHGEGISEELFGSPVHVYKSTERLERKLKEKFEEHRGEVDTDSIAYILLEPLTALIGFKEKTFERSEAPPGVKTKYPLNRHGVIHAKDLDYATEANGLRCVALLMLLSEAKETLEQGTNSSGGDEQ